MPVKHIDVGTALTKTEWEAAGTHETNDTLTDADGDTLIQLEESSNEDIIRIDTAGTERITIGATGDITMIQSSASTITPHLANTCYSSDGSSNPEIHLSRANGTLGSPDVSANTDAIGSIKFEGYQNSAFRSSVEIAAVVDGSPAGNYVPGTLQFKTATAAADPVARMTIDTTGFVGIGVTSPSRLLDLNTNIIRLRVAYAPPTAGTSGNEGDICWGTDSGTSYVYVCISDNTWERATLASW